MYSKVALGDEECFKKQNIVMRYIGKKNIAKKRGGVYSPPLTTKLTFLPHNDPVCLAFLDKILQNSIFNKNMRSPAKRMKIQKMPKSNLDVMKYRPRYLQVSLGCKLSIFQFSTILEHFCAFLQPKLP